jgi:catechol-2,3-dioxygenase
MQPQKPALDVGIVARDAEALATFYVDVLGFTYIERFDTTFGSIHRLGFGRSYLKIMQAPPSAVNSDQTANNMEVPGYRYLTLEMEDLHGVWAKAIASTETLSELRTVTASSLGSALSGMIRDPEGNIVELQRRDDPEAARHREEELIRQDKA